MTVVAMDRVSLALAGRTILASVSLSIGTGDFIGLLGANGAGKTTLLRAILGMVPVTGGSLTVFGQPPRRGHAAIGYMPQGRANLPETRLKGWDYVAATVQGQRIGLPLYGAALRKKVDAALGLVEAQALARRPLAELSGGERQRLLLAQALVDEPKLLLLDEPLLNLDPGQQRRVVALVKHLHEELRVPVVFSSHELNPLLGAISRVLYLGHGEAAIGAVDDVITGPVLSRLYNAPIEVHRVGTRIFVMSGNVEVERDAHRHEHEDGHHHGHDHHA
ncbi:MAG: ATP-binding cassette domain-containing protein [Alphaproteobacteria bacterium]|nr:ATP-binding cassette domain-containing protein [Alphaproteobacteria bacterium]